MYNRYYVNRFPLECRFSDVFFECCSLISRKKEAVESERMDEPGEGWGKERIVVFTSTYNPLALTHLSYYIARESVTESTEACSQFSIKILSLIRGFKKHLFF
jgi:hypothetical protein